MPSILGKPIKPTKPTKLTKPIQHDDDDDAADDLLLILLILPPLVKHMVVPHLSSEKLPGAHRRPGHAPFFVPKS